MNDLEFAVTFIIREIDSRNWTASASKGGAVVIGKGSSRRVACTRALDGLFKLELLRIESPHREASPGQLALVPSTASSGRSTGSRADRDRFAKVWDGVIPWEGMRCFIKFGDDGNRYGQFDIEAPPRDGERQWVLKLEDNRGELTGKTTTTKISFLQPSGDTLVKLEAMRASKAPATF